MFPNVPNLAQGKGDWGGRRGWEGLGGVGREKVTFWDSRSRIRYPL